MALAWRVERDGAKRVTVANRAIGTAAPRF